VNTAAVLFSAFTLLAAAPTAPAPLSAVRELRVGPIGETKTRMELIFAGPAAPCGERLKGSFSVFGSGGIAVDGTVAPHPEGGCSVRFEMPFSAVGPEALANVNLSAVGWSVVGELSENGKRRTVKWAGSIPREAVKLTESMQVTLRRFVTVRDVGLGNVSIGQSTVNVDLEIVQPLSFDLGFVEASYELTVGDRVVASGRRERFLLHTRQRNTLRCPVNLDHAALLLAAGQAAWSGEVEGMLTGVARMRVPAGELEFPFEFPVTLSRK
jgi:hypothetical protein